MSEQDLIQIFGAVDLLDLPEKMLPIVLSNSEQRNDIYRKLLYINNYDVSKDWFQEIFEQRMSERKDKKQDFTPATVSILAFSITGTKDGSFHEPTAGNGSMIIADWWRKAQLHVPHLLHVRLHCRLHRAGLDYYGCEIDEGYFRDAQERFDRICLGTVHADGATIKQGNIFEQ